MCQNAFLIDDLASVQTVRKIDASEKLFIGDRGMGFAAGQGQACQCGHQPLAHRPRSRPKPDPAQPCRVNGQQGERQFGAAKRDGVSP
jgi:hypothetical protein